MGLSLKKIGRSLSDVFDANSKEDQRKRLAAGQARLYADQQRAMGNKRPANNLGQQIFGNTARVVNTVGGIARETPGTIREVAALASGNDVALRNAVNNVQKVQVQTRNPNAGFLKAGTIFDNAHQTLNPGETAKRFGSSYVGAIGETAPIPATKAFKNANLAIKTAKVAGVSGAAAVAGDIGSQVANRGKVNWKEAAVAGLTSTALGAGIPLAGAGGKFAAKGIKAMDEAARRAEALRPVTQPVVRDAAQIAQYTKPQLKIKNPSLTGEVIKNGPVVARNNGGLRDQVGEAMIDKDAVIINQLKDIEKQTGKKGIVQKFLYNSNMQRQAPGIATHDFANSQHIKDAVAGLSKDNYAQFTDYAAARRELANAKEGLPTSRPVSELRAVVAQNHSQFKGNYASLNQYYKELAPKARDAGLIDDARLKSYAKDNNYIRLQRDMGDLQAHKGTGSGYSLGQTILGQKRTGSARQVLDPVGTALHYAQQVQGEIQRNTTAAHLVSTLHEHGLSKQLINADDVAARRAAFSRIKELKPVREGLKKQVAQATKNLTELTKRNTKLGPEVLDKIKGSQQEVRNRSIRIANGAKQLPGQSKRVAIRPTEAHIHEAFQEYLDGNPALVRKMYEFTGNKSEAARVQKSLEKLKAQYDGIKKESQHQWLTAKAHADLPTRNLNTLSFLKNGIKETHLVDSEIKRVANNIAPFQLNALEKVIGAPARTLRAGATALNPVFTASNILKDQLGSAVISSSTRATHSPENFGAGLKNATQDYFGGVLGKHSSLYEEYIKRGGDRTQYDLTRNAKGNKEIIDLIRGGQKTAVKQAMLHPIRSLENANAITEKATRFQNFKGIYEKSVAEGANHEAAIQNATMAALEHTVNFGRAGSWGRIINLTIPYSNAAIQGGRTLANAGKARPFLTASKGFAWVGTPIAAATLWNLSDPERKKVYDNISPYEKQNNLILIKPGTKVGDVKTGNYNLVKIPLPPDIGNIFQPIRRGIEAMKGGKAPNAHELIADVTRPFVGPLDISSQGAFINSIEPQGAKPYINQVANKDFYTGKQIVPDFLKDANTDPTKRVNKHTSSIARIIGGALNTEPVRIDKAASDVAGKLGTFGINATDNALAKLGKAKLDNRGKPIVGGQSIGAAFSQRFSKATAITDPNNEAQKHFNKVAQYTKGLNKNEMAAYNTIHTNKVDGVGPDKTYYDSSLKATVYEKYPKVLEADNKINKGNGEPFYNLPSPQQKVILTLNTLSNDPGSATAKKITKDNPWLQGYYDKQSDFFDKLAASGKIKASDGKLQQPPIAKGPIKAALADYNNITDSSQKSAFLNAHPEVTDFFSSTDEYQRHKREALGLPQFDKYPTASPDVQRKLAIYNSLPQHDGKKGGNATRAKFIAANPDVSDYFAKASAYGVIKDAQLAQFEGEELSAKNASKIAGGGSYSSHGSYGSSNKSDYSNPYKYAISTRGSGSIKKPTVRVKAGKASQAVSFKSRGKPKVSVKKSKV